MLTARIELLVAALFLSTGGAAIKASNLGAWQVAALRSGIAALVLFSLLPAARRGWRTADVLVAFPYAATLVLYVTGNKLTTAANTIFLQSTAPLYVAFLGPFLLREHLEWREAPYIAALIFGLALFFLGQESLRATAPDPRLGNVVAAASGVTWGLTLMGLRWRARSEGGESALPAVVCGNVLAFVACVLASWPLPALPAREVLLVAYLGSIQIALAYALMAAGFRHVPAARGALLLLLEPVLNPVWAWWFHRERPSELAIAGGAVVLGAAAALSLRSSGSSVDPRLP